MSDFTQVLGANINNTTAKALLLTVVTDPNRSIGEIEDALQKEPELNYLIDIFRSLTISDIVEASAAAIAMAQRAAEDAELSFVAPVEIPGVEGEPEAVAAKPKRKTTKRKAPTNAKGASGKGGDKIDLSSPDSIKAYEAKVTKFLRNAGAKDGDSAVPASAIRGGVGGSPAQLRQRLNALIETKSVDYVGRARGTKYFLA